jgi:aryl-alcohol dehydrogenase-like predicted oxidoreductase
MNRRDAIKVGVGTSLTMALDPTRLVAEILQGGLIEHAIPSSGEKIPVIGIGTARRYDVSSAAEKAPLRDVLTRFPQMGGKLIDTAPGYGQAEAVVGELINEIGNRPKYFLATKVSARNGDRSAALLQMQLSQQKLHSEKFDLLQIHNMSSPGQLLPLLREWKQAGKIRYLGVTTSSDGQYDSLIALMKSEQLDFIQVDYAIDNRGAEQVILPLAKDRGMGVLINLPFGRTSVFQKVQGKALPEWAKEIDCASWAQIFLKYIVSHPSVTAAIPGTAKVEYLVDNLGAARGRLPDAAMRKRIEEYFDAV